VDRTIRAIEHAKEKEKPFYINLWPDDIHTPLEPPQELRGDLSTKSRFLGVMEEMDNQFGRLFDYIRRSPDLSHNTLIIFTSDNGPDDKVNKAGHLKGFKTELYEGGIREPFIAWWPSVISEKLEGSINKETVISGIDLPLIFRAIAGISIDKNIDFDGENMLDAIAGTSGILRNKPLFWIRPPDRPGYYGENAPDIAIRKGEYKLLMDFDGNNIQLYNILLDESENNNLYENESEIVIELKSLLNNWHDNYAHTMDKSKISF
jgi:arylsulfatase A-like enzyme